MKLACRITATKNRKRWANTLQALVGYAPTIVWNEPNDLWGGARRTLESYEPGDTHMLVLQDDVLPCRDLVATACKLIELRPDNPITLFTTRPRIDQCRLQQLSWLRVGKWLMAQAYIVPIPLIQQFIKYADEHIDPRIYYDDNRWAMFCYYNKINVFATAPSLVEHLGWNSSTLSTYKNNGQEFEPRLRMAKWYIGFENSGLDVDWSNISYVDDPDGSNSDFCSYLK